MAGKMYAARPRRSTWLRRASRNPPRPWQAVCSCRRRRSSDSLRGRTRTSPRSRVRCPHAEHTLDRASMDASSPSSSRPVVAHRANVSSPCSSTPRASSRDPARERHARARQNTIASSSRARRRDRHRASTRAPRRHAFSAYDNIPIAVATVAFVVIARVVIARVVIARIAHTARARVIRRRVVVSRDE